MLIKLHHGEPLLLIQELLGRERVVSEGWRCGGVYQLVFATGVLALLTVNTATSDVIRVVFDRFLVGKLLSEHLADGRWKER